MAEFGSGLGSDTADYGSPAPASAGGAGGGGADGQSGAPAPSPQSPSMFGSGIYQSAPQGADPLDIAAGQLQQRIEAAQRATTGPGGAILGLFNPEARQHNLQLIPAATEQLQKIREQKATIQANQQQAATLGLAPGEVPDQATQEQRVTFAKNRALQGDLKVYQGLAAVDPKAAESIADQVHEAVGAHLQNAKFAYDKLSMMSTAGEYNAAVKELRQNGTLSGIEALGFKVPDGPQGFANFNAGKAREGAALRDAQINLSSIRQKLEDRNTYQPMEKKEAETYSTRLTTAAGGLPIDNVTWSRNGASGTRGAVVNGMGDPRDLGKSFTLVRPETMKPVVDQFNAAVPKEDLEKYRAFNRTYDLATKDAKGNPVAAGDINTNPNVQQGIAEGLASMLRGGNGGANVGLLKIELQKRGWTQQMADAFTSNYNGIWNTIEGKQIAPQLTQLTRGQVRDVLDTLHDYNAKAMADRVGPIAEAAGAAGYGPQLFGLGKDESHAGIDDAIERGRQAEIQRITPLHQAIGGGDGVLQLGAQRPGATATGLPPGAQPANQLPGAAPLRTPAQQAMGGAPPPAPAGPQPGITGPAAAGITGPAAAGGGAPSPNQPAPSGSQPGGSGGGPFDRGAQPFQPSPDPVTHAMNGIAAAVHQFAAANGGTPAHADAQVQKLATNKRVEKELETTGQVSGETVAKAMGAGSNKTLVGHLTDFLNKWFMQGVPEGQRDQAAADIGNAAVQHAPAIGSTLGAVAGGAAGPAGAVAGGAAGGAGGQSLKDWILGRPQDPAKIAEEGALGGVLGLAPEGRPLVGAALRMAGAGGVEAGAEAARGGTSKETFEAGMKGAGAAAGGELFGRALGMAGHKIFSLFGADSQKAVYSAAKDYAEAKHVLDTEPNRLPGVGTAAGGPNPKYLAAETQAGKAETVLKDAGLDPTEAAYAYKVTENKTTPVSRSEAQVNKPGEIEKARIGQGYQQLESEIGSAGRGAPRANVPQPNFPINESAREKVMRTGYDNVVRVDASKLRQTADSQATNGLTINPDKLDAVRKAGSGDGYPRVDVTNGKVSIEDGVHRTTVAAERGQTIDVAVKSSQEAAALRQMAAPGRTSKLPDGPTAAVESGAVSQKHAELAQRTEMAITAPAANWQEKWAHLKDARSALLTAERDAQASTAPGKTLEAADMRRLADTVRVQQEKAAKYVFGPEKGEQFVQRLKVLDTRYRTLMEATNGGDMAAAAKMRGEDGRNADKAFRAFAAGDPSAIAAWDALRKPGSNVEKDVRVLVGAEKIPVLGHIISAAKLMMHLGEWRAERAAGSPVKFVDILRKGEDTTGKMFRDVGGAVGSRAAVMR